MLIGLDCEKEIWGKANAEAPASVLTPNCLRFICVS
jgi:hypothetical protein